jgi:hypothetical protein
MIRDFRFDSPIQTPYRPDDLSLQGFSWNRSTVFPLAPEGAGFAPASTQPNAPKGPFSRAHPQTLPRQASAVIEICSALHAPDPAGMGKAATFRSMSANSRRVRWLSANSNQ